MTAPSSSPAPPPASHPSTKPWGGRFSESPHPAAEGFTASLGFDRRLWRYDLAGSEAWARALAKAGLLTEHELAALLKGLEEIRQEFLEGSFPFRRELEDIHMNIERRLQEKVGEIGGKLHTGRSRNDQIALDERLYLRDVIKEVDRGLSEAQSALIARAEEFLAPAQEMPLGVPMPGYTHLQRAQPILLSHHLLAHVFMLQRDRERFTGGLARANVLPLGAGALAGTAFPIDREALARDLGFSRPSRNSLDAVSDRDFILEFLGAAAILGMHLSRLAADLTLWATAEFGFVEFPDAFATGSSIMPQKKNPDVAELIRGKTGRLYGNLVAVLTAMKGLPLGYHSDMQEDKEPLFDSIDTLEAIFGVLPPMLRSLTFHVDRMRTAAGEHYSTATDLADYLVRKGLPFRQAHELVGQVIRQAAGTPLEQLSLETFSRFSPLFGPDVFKAISLEASLKARAGIGGTAPEAVRRALAEAKALAAEEIR
jgi:argininosuccinate lyase